LQSAGFTVRQPRFSTAPRATADSLTQPAQGYVKGALALCVLLLLGLLFWQVIEEFKLLEDGQRQRQQAEARQLVGHLQLSMTFKAQTGLIELRAYGHVPASKDQAQQLLTKLRTICPALHSLAWLDDRGEVMADSDEAADDPSGLSDLYRQHANAPFHFASVPGERGVIYLLLRNTEPEPGGATAWVMRLSTAALNQWLPETPGSQWLLEDVRNGQVILQPEGSGLASTSAPRILSVTERQQTIEQLPIAHSDWQLRALFDNRAFRDRQLPHQAGKLLIFVFCAGLSLFALVSLLGEQRRLRKVNEISRRSLRDAANALRAIDERVLVTHPDGRLLYLNPQAEQMFGLSSADAQARHLLNLLPQLSLWFEGSEDGPDTIEVLQNGEWRIFSVTRSLIEDEPKSSGHVWVLRDITVEQHALRFLQETRRRYKDIFEECGVALCVFDLVDLRLYLTQQTELTDSSQLPAWLEEAPERNLNLVDLLRVTEANQLALRLFQVEDVVQGWEQMGGQTEMHPGNLRYELIAALLDGKTYLEMERRVTIPNGEERYLWMTLHLPARLDDLHAVTMSISDITSRKRTELSLVESERFWSDVVRAIPDTLFVQDIQARKMLFSNHEEELKLGYDDGSTFGNDLLHSQLHPDDADYYWRLISLQQSISDGRILEFKVRCRHSSGEWHWYHFRKQVMGRDEKGQPTRMIGVARDVTREIIAQQSLSESERRYRQLAESMNDVIISTDSDLKINYISPSAENFFGYSPSLLMRSGMESMLTDQRQIAELFALARTVKGAAISPLHLDDLQDKLASRMFVFDCLHADGHKIHAEMRAALIRDEQDRLSGLLCIVRDISQQRRAEREMRMAATVFEHSTAAILITDPAGYIVQVNEVFSRITGYAVAQVLDQLPAMLTADRQQAGFLDFILGQLSQRGSWEGEVWLKRSNGENYPAWVGITAVLDDEGDMVSYVCFFNDISERKASEQRIHRLAYYDALTQLPNRTLFQDRLHTALQHAERHDEWVVLMFLDLDRFKPINDSLGHAAGDRMLKEVALRLTACVGEDDTVARMGGDEFTLLLQARDNRDDALNRAVHVAEQILASLATPFILQNREFFVTASIGIALSPQDGGQLSHLMKNADTAMYHAKERGKNNFQFYQADMNATALQRLELESDLRHALDQGQLMLYYQPQLSGDGKRLTGVEALLRWQHPTRGLVPPTEFIPVMEEIGLIMQVGDWVIEEACRQLKEWHATKVRVPKISVNISARQFTDGQLGMRIAHTLQELEVPPACLELELTESILMRDVSETMQILASLKKLGLSIAVDDFGTGYSSLNYLKQLPIDVLKIDRSFVDGLPDGEQDAQIARAIIAMSHSLNLAVIAEGVETQEQLEFLRQHGCDEVQGYLFGKPMPANQFAAQFGGLPLFLFN
jgi:diguanylate cyclase (GGDEF)-like protein/PAS domain S-box-containing protein